MNIYSDATANEIRREINEKDDIDINFLSGALAVLCSRVDELKKEVESLRKATP